MKRRFIRIAVFLLLFSFLLNPSALAASAPVAENQEISTYRGISVGGSLIAVTCDEGPVTFSITTAPSKGTVELKETGEFIYTPNEKSRGRDYFGYRATDSSGQESREATVIIRLCRQKKNLRYADTAGLSCDYAAHVLAEKDIFTGASLKDTAVFDPERTMSRGEFLSLCMACAGTGLLTAVDNTGYEDDDTLADWLKPYVATALFEGFGSSGRCSGAEEMMTQKEAGELINACFALSAAPCSVPEEQTAANLRACGLWNASGESEPAGLITRGEAAVLLQKAMELRER